MSTKTLKTITQVLLLSVIAIIPFIKTTTLYFPFISGKVYLFRALVALAFFFWTWMMLENHKSQITNHKQITNSKLQNTSTFLSFRNILVAALVLFFAAQVFVSFFSVDPFYSFFSTIDRQDGVFQYGFWVLYFLMLVSVFRKNEDWKKFFSVFISAALLLSAYSFLASDPAQPDFSGRFGNPAYFGAFLLFAIGFSLILCQNRFFKSKHLNIGLLFAAGFFALALIFTYIRGAYTGFAGGVFLFCLLTFLFLRKESKNLAHWCGVILLVGIVSIASLFAARNTDFVQNSVILSRVTEVVDIWEVASVRERLLNWSIALKAFEEKPVFGWGPENYGVAANKYYDFRIGENEPWFDRSHNQPLDILATGGMVLFAFYLFWIFAGFYLVWKIAKERKILSFILASVFSAYLIQGFFLFDTLAVYLGLFPFLAYLVAASRQPPITADIKQINADRKISGHQQSSAAIRRFILFAAGIFSLFLIYATVVIPWRANNAAWHFFQFTENGFYKETKPYLEKAFSIRSPYTYWELRKMVSWKFREVLEFRINEETPPEKIVELRKLYDFLTPEFERHITAKPVYPQMYNTLAAIYRFGYEKLNKDDLDKAESVLRRAFSYSDLRVEYYNELAKVLSLQGKFEEAEDAIKGHAERMPPEWGEYMPFVTLGNFYFEAEKYELALERYERASEVGFEIQEKGAVYSRYMLAAEKVGDYQKVVDMAQKFLHTWGPDADTYFNVAVGYFHLEDREKAREFFLKALELKSEYEEYRAFFTE